MWYTQTIDCSPLIERGCCWWGPAELVDLPCDLFLVASLGQVEVVKLEIEGSQWIRTDHYRGDH